MTYVPANVPDSVDQASYFAEEHQRIANAYNWQEALGGLAVDPDTAPISQQYTFTPVVLNCWGVITPNPTVSDGPILTDPQVSPAGTIEIHDSGIYIMMFNLAFGHDKGAEASWQLYYNGNKVAVGTVLAASQQTEVSSVSASGILAFEAGSIVDMRGAAPIGVSTIIDVQVGSFQVFKLRDLRTRFS